MRYFAWMSRITCAVHLRKPQLPRKLMPPLYSEVDHSFILLYCILPKLSAKNLFRILHTLLLNPASCFITHNIFILFFPVSNICISKILSQRLSLKHLLLLTYMSAICVYRFIYLHLVVFFMFPYISKSFNNDSFHSKLTLT